MAFLCQATSHVLTTEGPEFCTRLEGILAQPGILHPALHPWATGLVGEIARHAGDTAAADAAFRAVLLATPEAQREALMLADLLLARGDAAGVVAVPKHSPDTDGVLIRRQQASAALGLTDEATALAATLDTRFRLNLSLGLTALAREEIYFLDTAADPALALTPAQVNWALQHEIEDAVLLLRAARAAGKPEAAQPVTDRMAEAGVAPPPDLGFFSAPGETRPVAALQTPMQSLPPVKDRPMRPAALLPTLAAALCLAALPAPGQTGEGVGKLASGFPQPIPGLDHMLAMVAVGLWGAILGAQKLK